MTIEDRVKTVIARTLYAKPDISVLKDERSLATLGADSLDMMEIVMGLEQEFSIEISDEDSLMLTTVGEHIAYIKKRVVLN